MERHIHIQAEDFSVDEVLSAIRARHGQAGAVVTFVGLVRERVTLHTETTPIDTVGVAKLEAGSALYLEHFPGVTERSIAAIADQAAARWPLLEIVIVHRVGWLEPREQIVLVVTVSIHRHAAFESAAFLMDYLKTDAVLWKKERAGDGAETWIEATSGDLAATEAWADHDPRG